MKTRIQAVISIILLLAIPAMGQNGAQPSVQPKLAIERTDHNFGEVSRGDSPTHTFVFKNTGTDELRITNVAPS